MKKRRISSTFTSHPDELFVVPQDRIQNTGEAVSASRIPLLGVVAAVLILVLMGRGAYLSMAESAYLDRAEGNRTRTLVQYAPRGVFFDANGRQLIENVPSTDLVAYPLQLPPDAEQVISVLREIFPDVPATEFGNRLLNIPERSSRPIPVLADITDEQRIAVLSRTEELPGIGVESRAVRQYEGEGILSHILGYIGRISPEEKADRPEYLLTETIGKSGIERQYEEMLRGMHGSHRVEVNALGETVNNLGTRDPIRGVNIRLHINMDLQEKLAEALREAALETGTGRAAAVALNPQNGAVKALVSVPWYDHTSLARGSSQSIEEIFTDPNIPLFNRVLQGQYPPGSTFKLAIAAGILEEEIASPNDTITSTGGISVGRWRFPDWRSGGHGITDIRKAIADSVNSYFYIFGGGYEEKQGLGLDGIIRWANRLGIGSVTGIDIPAESKGFLPSEEWKREAKGESWYIGDTYNLSIGQGDVLTTPLQVALLTMIVANGGMFHAPRVADVFMRPDGSVIEDVRPPTEKRRVISSDVARVIQEGMRAAVTDGSARRLSLLSTPIAGKTGTAQTGKPDKNHAWFTSFAPYEDPELVLVILVEEAGGGEEIAVPVADKVYRWYFGEEIVVEEDEE